VVRKVLAVLAVLEVLQVLSPRAETTPSLVGTWTLTRVERGSTDGAWIAQPLPRGVLILDRGGHAFELAETGRRVPYAANQPTPAEAHAVYNNYSGFWGSYKINAPAGTITYRPEGAISPNAMAQDVVRAFERTDDRLVVTATANEPDGLSGTRWIWERVPQLETLSAANRKLLGFWRHVVEKRFNVTTGEVQSETERAPSIIVYSASGFVGVHFPPMNRAKFVSAQPTDEEARAAIAGFVSYYGAYTLSPGVVFHHRLIILGTAPGDTLKRFYDIAGDTLTLKFPPGRNQQGQEIRTEVTLKRISGEKEMLP
jgi:Lipocalin-like domain